MIILYEFVDLMEVIRIKMIAFYAEMPFDRFGKELRFVGVSLGDQEWSDIYVIFTMLLCALKLQATLITLLCDVIYISNPI